MHTALPPPSPPWPQALDEPFAYFQNRLVNRDRLWADVAALAAQLPDRRYQFNLCENRYLFCIALLAAAARGQTCLLPPSSQLAVIDELRQDYPHAYLAGDTAQAASDAEWFEVKPPQSGALDTNAIAFDWERDAVIVFTSGSTGRPKPCAHSLSTFKTSAEMAIASLGLGSQNRIMVSTTPPQHMYGLETSIFWPLFSKLLLHDGRPFFPEDIRLAVETAPCPAMLVSTPTHLRLLVKAGGNWHNLAGILSATDTLSEQLGRETRAILGQSPHEIYGSTETLSFANRETILGQRWQPYRGVRLNQQRDGTTLLQSPHLPAPIRLQDCLDIDADGRFTVLGRHGDMVKISGKRASLSELNRRLKDIAGVEDGFCYVQRQGPHQGRIAAVVVGDLDKQLIRAGFEPYVADVFMPKKIDFVSRIPRNDCGKLTQDELEKLLAALS